MMKTVVLVSTVLLLIFVINVVYCESQKKDVWKITEIDKELIAGSPMGGSRSVDPKFARMTWNLFNRHNSRNEKRDRQKIKKSMRNMQQTRSGLRSGGIMMGPMGPRGPVGPPGPKGGNFTREEIVEIARAVYRLESRKQLRSGDKNLVNDTDMGGVLQPEQSSMPKLTVFIWKHSQYTKVPKNSRVEIENFSSVLSNSDATAASWGRYKVPRTGFYRFEARVHVQVTRKSMGSKELFSVCICFNGICGDKKMLETISGFGPGERMTVQVSGIKYLKAHEFVSIFIDNASNFPIDVFDGSEFTGYMLGE